VHAQHCAALDGTGWEGLGLVVGATFFKTVRNWFSRGSIACDVIRFLADFRVEIANHVSMWIRVWLTC
jgi:hypothetical protein